MTIAEKVAENGNNPKIKTVGNAFTKEFKLPQTIDARLEIGDIIVIPDSYDVQQQLFGNDRNGNPITSEFIVLTVKSTNGAERAINWFPTSIVKNIFPVEKDANGLNKIKPPVNPTGAVADLARQFLGKGIQGFMDAVKAKGNRIMVKGYTEVVTAKFNQNTGKSDPEQTTTTRVYQYEWPMLKYNNYHCLEGV